MLDFNNFKENLEVLGEDIFSKKFLLAVSGGADSMVLSHLFRFFDSAQNDKGLEFQVAHLTIISEEKILIFDQKIVEDFCKKKMTSNFI